MAERRKLKLRTAYIRSCRAPYPVQNSWDGTYRQRITIHNTENKTDVECDLSACELVYFIEQLEGALSDLQKRMLRDCDLPDRVSEQTPPQGQEGE